MASRNSITALIFFLLLFSRVPAAQASTVTWNDGNSNWNNSANWSPAVVPNNSSPNFYDVVINSNTISLDTSPTVNSLTLASPATVNFQPGSSLTLGDLNNNQVGVLTNAGTVNVTNANSTLAFDLQAAASSFSTNTGTIALGAGTLSINDNATNGGSTKALVLGGAGTVSLAGGVVKGVSGDEQMFSSNTIHGFGTIQNLQFNVTSGGAVTADQAGQTLTLVALSPTVGIFNQVGGKMGATAGGQLVLDATNSFFTNDAGATIQTNGGNITLKGNASGASIAASFFNNGTINIQDGDTLTFAGTGVTNSYAFENNAAINLGSGAAGATLALNEAGSTFVLESFGNTGTLVLSDSANNHIIGLNGTETLTNSAGHTISGAGSITGLTFFNNGTVSATGVNPLIISNLASYNSAPDSLLLSGGTYSAANGSQLRIQNAAAGIGANAANIILNGTGRITDGGGNDIISPILSSNSGLFKLDNAASLSLTNGVNNSGTLWVTGNSTLMTNFLGNIGTIQVDAGSLLNTSGSIAANNTLTGGSYVLAGTLKYFDSVNEIRTIDFTTSLLLNGTGDIVNTSSGSGLGAVLTTNNGQLTLQNGNALTLTNDFTNNGVLTVDHSTFTTNGAFTNVGSLILQNTGTVTATGNFSNQSSVSIAPGSLLDLSNASWLDEQNGTLTNSGSYFVAGTLQYNGNNLTTLDFGTSLTLDGAGKVLNIGSDALSSSLTTNNGSLTFQHNSTINGFSYALQKNFVNNGFLQVGNTFNTPDQTTVFMSGSLLNNGAISVQGGAALRANHGFTEGQFASISIIDSFSLFDVSGGTFTNLDASGVLTNLNLSAAGTFFYTGADITRLSGNTSIDLQGAGQIINSTGSLHNGLVTLNTIDSGSSFTIRGNGSLALTGALNNSGNLLVGDGTTAGTLTGNGLTNSGFLSVGLGSLADFRGGPFVSLNAGTLALGTYQVFGTLEYTGGQVVTNNANVTIGVNGVFQNNLGQDVFSGALATNNGQIDVGNYAGGNVLTTPAGFTQGQFASLILRNASSMNVNGSFVDGLGAVVTLLDGSHLAITGALDNSAGSNVVNLSGIGSVLTANGFNNGPNSSVFVSPTGTMNVAGPGNTAAFQNLNAGTLAVGNYTIGGTFQFGSDASGLNNTATISTIGAGTNVTLDSNSWQFLNGAGQNALSTLSSIRGSLALSSNAALAVSGGLTVNGSLTVGQNFSPASLIVAGSLNNIGQTVVSGTGSSLTAAGFTNTDAGTFGFFEVNQGSADFRGPSNNSPFTNLSATGTLGGGTYEILNGTFQYGGDVNGNNATLILRNNSNFLELSGNAMVLNGSGANALAALNANNTFLILESGYQLTTNPGTAFTNGANATVELFGGASNMPTTLALGGALTNNGNFFVESGFSTVTAPGFTNSGSLFVSGSSTADFRGGAFTNLTGNVLTGGTYNIGGKFQYDGTQTINEIGSGTSFSLTGPAFSALNGSGANALAALEKVDAGATFNLLSSATLTTDPGFVNQGSTNITSSTLNVTLGSFDNQSSLNINSGSLDVVNGQFVNSGTAALSNGLVTSLGLNNTGSLSLAHSVVNASGGTFTNLDGSGNLGGGGSYLLSNASFLEYTGGKIVNILASTTLNLSDTSGIFNNAGSVASNANALSALASNAGSLTIQRGYGISTPGDFTNTGSVTVGAGFTSTLSTFQTAGAYNNNLNGTTLVQTGGALNVTGQFSNAGTADIFSGVLTAGSINNSSLLNLSGGSISTGLFTNTASGVVNLGANFVTESLTATGLVNAGLISFNGGFGSPAFGITVNGDVTNTGSVQETAANSTFTVHGNFNNNTNGAVNVGGASSVLTVDNTLTNQASVTIASDGSVSAGHYTQTAGTTQVDGALSAATVLLQAGTLKGIGDITGNVSNTGGIVAPGDSPGIETITGNYSQGSAGDLLIQIAGDTAGSQYSQLKVTGTATLDGSIEFDFINFVPDAVYKVLFYASETGQFSGAFVDNLPGYGAFLTYMPTELDVTFSQITPEPSTLGMTLIALLGVGIAIRRRARSAQFK